VRYSTDPMINLQPLSGHFEGRSHCLPIRIYFEDTDFSGLVYHANYLRYMERARSDMLRCVGIGQRDAFAAGDGVYAVTDLSIKYVRPARFDDAVLVISTVERLRAASVLIHQRVMRGDQLLSKADVTAAFLSPEGRPKRQPTDWIAAFQPLLPLPVLPSANEENQ
jgi:acyl-CoA thioester hydrolase